MSRPILCALLLAWSATLGAQQQPLRDLLLRRGFSPAIAIPPFRGSGAAQQFMAAFNDTLAKDLERSGYFSLRPRGLYPLNIPQRPDDLRKSSPSVGLTLKDWGNPPVGAKFLAIGYAAFLAGKLTVWVWLFDATQDDPATALVWNGSRAATSDQPGARELAHQVAAGLIRATSDPSAASQPR